MKLGRLIAFSLLFAVAVTIYLFQTRLEKQALTSFPDEVNRIFMMGEDDFPDHLEIQNQSEKTRVLLAKEGEAWALVSPVVYPADPEVIAGVVSGLRRATQQPRLRAEKEWEEYGLSQPVMEVTMAIPGKKAETLFVGAQAPVGDAFFARWSSERGYFLLRGDVKEALQQSVYSFREKRVFRTPPSEMQKVYVEMGPLAYQWKKDGPEWYWMEPLSKFGQKIPLEAMGRVLAALRGLYIKEFLDDNKKSKADLGFFIIHDRIRIDSRLGKPEILHFGNEVPLQNAYFGFREGEPTVFLLDQGKVFQLLDLLKNIENTTE